MKKIVFSILMIFAIATLAVAQTTTGRLSGVVSTNDGVLPGATVTATDNTTSKTQTTNSKEDGTFLFPQLEFGTYTVTVTANGFKSFTANEVKIDVGREYNLPATLEIGNVQENVTITAGADVLSQNTPQISNTVSPQQILSLPLITRSPLSLTTLQAGTTTSSAQNTTINGMRTTFTNITSDGINIQDTFIRTNATDFAPGRPSVDDTSEFTITTSNAESDQGYGGAQIRLVTPRGSKDFHGALFAYNRNSRFAANNFFNNKSGAAIPFRNRNQFGGKVSGPLPLPGFNEGGPIVEKNKGFFFFNYEGIRDPLSGRSTRTILTPTARAGGFQFNRTNTAAVTNPFVSCPSTAINSVCTITNFLGYARSLGFAVPATIDPIVQARIISQLPTQSNATGGDGLNTAGYALNRREDQIRNQYATRIDVDFDDNNSFNGVIKWNKESNLRDDADTTKFTTVPGVIQFSKNRQYSAAYRHNFSPTIINELRGGAFLSDVPFNRVDPTPSYFLNGLNTANVNTDFAANLVTFPEDTFLSQGRNTAGYNLQDNVDLIVGKHSIRFGGQLQFFKVNSYNDALIVPTYALQTGTSTPAFSSANFTGIGGISTTQLGTANNLLALLGGIVNGGFSSFNTTSQTSGFSSSTTFQPFRYSNHSLYVADRWQIRPDLTIYGGLRYELFPALKLANGLAIEPVIKDVNNPIPSLLDPNGTYNFIGTNSGVENTYYKTDYNNFGPSIGFSYAPRFENGVMRALLGGEGETVLRGGYSQVYGNDSIVTSINNAAAGNVGLGRTQVNAVLNDRVANSVSVINPPAFITPPRTYLQNNTSQFNFFGTVFAVDPKLQTPKVEQYSLGIQREFFKNTAVEVRYVGTRSKNLARGVDFNQIDIFNNGFLNDFNRASANFRLTGNAFCTTAGCQSLTIFQNGGTPQAGRLTIGTGGLSATTFNNNLNNGTPADLALSFIQNGFNNQPNSANPTASPFVKFLANPATGAIDYFVNDGRYNYNSLQIEVRRRFSKGLYFQANYTFSKNLTNAIGTSQALFEPYIDNNNKSLDNQRADYDLTHVFNFNGIYQLPFGKGKAFLNQGGVVDRIFGGFEFSGLMQWTSGVPITFVDTRGTFNRTGRSTRQTPFTSLTNDQIRALGGLFRASNGAVYLFDPSALNVTVNPTTGQVNSTASSGFGSTPFSGQVLFNVNPGQTGNLQRAIIDGPTFFNVNMSLLKSIRLTETSRIQLRMEAFNAFNTTNFTVSQARQLQNINSTTFGQLTTAAAARQIQFAARFEF